MAKVPIIFIIFLGPCDVFISTWQNLNFTFNFKDKYHSAQHSCLKTNTGHE